MDSIRTTTAAAATELGAMIETVTAHCLECRALFATTRVKNIRTGNMEQVEAFCVSHRKPDLQMAPLTRDLDAEWLRVCHGQFTDTIVERIPECIRAKFRSYRYGNLGIFAVGPRGTYKSRTMHLLAKQLHYRGYRVKILSGVRLGIAIAESFENGGYSSLLDNLTTVQVLYIDDFDKLRLTARVEEGVFAILDERKNRQLPVFFTTNVRGDELEKMFTPNFGPAVRRRIAESCIPIEPQKILREHSLWDEVNNRPKEVQS